MTTTGVKTPRARQGDGQEKQNRPISSFLCLSAR
jgi:hypothetical protein